MANINKTRALELTRGKLSAATGCNIETIRYYENIGLMPEPRRSEGGRRLYGDDDVKRLSFILRCRELGFTLEETRALLDLVDGGGYTCAEVKEITTHQLVQVQIKIKVLRKLERVLKEMIDKCDGGHVPECPIIDALYR